MPWALSLPFILGLQIAQCLSASSPFLDPSACQVTEYFSTVSTTCERCVDRQLANNDSLGCMCQPGFRQNGSVFDLPRCEQCNSQQVLTNNNFCLICPIGTTLNRDLKCDCAAGEIAVDIQENGKPQEQIKCVRCADGFVPNQRKDRCVSCVSPFLSADLVSNCIDLWSASCSSTAPGSLGLPSYCLRLDDDVRSQEPFLTSIGVGPISSRITSSFYTDYKRLVISYTECIRQRRNSACDLVLNLCTLRGSSSDMDRTDRICSPVTDLTAQRMFMTDTEVETRLPPISFIADRARQMSRTGGNVYSFLDLRAAVYNLDGTFEGYKNATEGFLQMCLNRERFPDAWLGFGVNYVMKCQVKALDLWKTFATKYYQLYIVYPGKNEFGPPQLRSPQSIMMKYNVPVKMISPAGIENSKWLVRFFVVDNLSLRKPDTPRGNPADVVRYASKIQLRIRVNGTDAILPPQLLITYSDVFLSSQNSLVDVEFSVSYEASGASFDDIVKMLLIALIAVGFYVGIKLYGWFQRRGGDCDQGACLIPSIMLLIAGGGNVLTVVSLAISIWFLIAYKFQNYAVFMLPAKDDGEKAFIIVAVAALVCKLIHCLQIIIQQSTVDIFFLDWEQPKLSQIVSLATGPPATPSGTSTPAPRGSVVRSQPRSSNEAKPPVREHLHPVSVWRTLFVGNEWNELQVIRRTNFVLQYIVVAAIIEFLGLGNLATGDPYIDTDLSPKYYHSEFRRVLRFGITSSMYVIFVIAQWLFFIFIYERWVADAARNFVDLCALSNISVFVLAEQRHGYYIHGRLLHGHADTNQQELSDFLKSEARDESPQGGLFGTTQRTFEVMVPLRIRTTVDAYLLQIKQASSSKQRSSRGAPGHAETDYQSLAAAQESLKFFISNEVEKNGGNGSVVRLKKTFLENLFDIECVRSPEGMIFYEDDGRSFEDVLLLGHEMTMVMFELMLFSVVDMFACNATLAAFVCFVFTTLLIVLRANFGEKNVALKTGVDERFLI